MKIARLCRISFPGKLQEGFGVFRRFTEVLDFPGMAGSGLNRVPFGKFQAALGKTGYPEDPSVFFRCFLCPGMIGREKKLIVSHTGRTPDKEVVTLLLHPFYQFLVGRIFLPPVIVIGITVKRSGNKGGSFQAERDLGVNRNPVVGFSGKGRKKPIFRCHRREYARYAEKFPGHFRNIKV
jgi:hypothetical protein